MLLMSPDHAISCGECKPQDAYELKRVCFCAIQDVHARRKQQMSMKCCQFFLMPPMVLHNTQKISSAPREMPTGTVLADTVPYPHSKGAVERGINSKREANRQSWRRQNFNPARPARDGYISRCSQHCLFVYILIEMKPCSEVRARPGSRFGVPLT